jgi:hypothetical protein
MGDRDLGVGKLEEQEAQDKDWQTVSAKPLVGGRCDVEEHFEAKRYISIWAHRTNWFG